MSPTTAAMSRRPVAIRDGASTAVPAARQHRVVACPDCDALQAVEGQRSAGREVCFRCGALLAVGGPDRLDQALAYAAAAVPLFLLANAFPLMRMQGTGTRTIATVAGAAQAFSDQRLPALGLLMLVTTVLLPAFQVGAVGYLLLSLRRGRLAPGATAVMRVLDLVRPWAQIDILLLGILVAYGRLASVFQMVPGVGLTCLALFLLLERGVTTSFDARHFWERAEAAALVRRP
jgi:paraquat-inducible protein A